MLDQILTLLGRLGASDQKLETEAVKLATAEEFAQLIRDVDESEPGLVNSSYLFRLVVQMPLAKARRVLELLGARMRPDVLAAHQAALVLSVALDVSWPGEYCRGGSCRDCQPDRYPKPGDAVAPERFRVGELFVRADSETLLRVLAVNGENAMVVPVGLKQGRGPSFYVQRAELRHPPLKTERKTVVPEPGDEVTPEQLYRGGVYFDLISGENVRVTHVEDDRHSCSVLPNVPNLTGERATPQQRERSDLRHAILEKK